MPPPRWVALFLILAAQALVAEEADSLYDETLAVVERTEKARGEDMRRALAQVLGRIIAPEDLQTKAVASLLVHAADYADQYEYHSGDTVANGASGGKLQIRFDRERIDAALARAGLGVWGDGRPELLVWLRVIDGATARFVSAEDGGALTSGLQAAAAKRRLPVILPLLDLTDQANLKAEDLDTPNLARIRDAVWRYETDIALIGTLVSFDDFQWESRWRFVGPGQTAEWTLGPTNSEEALTKAVDGAFTQLVRLFAPGGHAVGGLDIRVEGIGSIGEGEVCGRYLRRLPRVRKAEWTGADANGVSWRLDVAGSVEAFQRLLADSRRLRPLADPGPHQAGRVYQWVP